MSKAVNVAAGIIACDGKVLATQRGYGDHAGKWEFPGGKVEAGETFAQACARELEEELGVRVSVGRQIAAIEHDYPDFHLRMRCFLCSVSSGEIVLREHRDARWVDRETIGGLDWLEADVALVEKLKAEGVV